MLSFMILFLFLILILLLLLLFGSFNGTPIFKKGLESPSAWKSPWFMSPLLSGQKFDTEMTLEVSLLSTFLDVY